MLLLKAFMVPTAEELPPLQPWTVADADVVWTSDKQGGLSAVAFGRQLSCAYVGREAAGEKKSLFSSAFGRIQSFFAGGANRPRAPPSAADPSALAQSPICCEDDVLHLKELPSFGGRVSSVEAEHLLQVLTVPYLRLPLLLSFFAPQHRVAALAETRVQEMLDATLFEPGEWLPPAGSPAVTEVPAPSRAPFATAAGLLVNEMQHAPEGLAASLLEIGTNALELDPGKFKPDGGPAAILYAVRLLTRVQSVARAMTGADDAAGAAGAIARARGMAPRASARRTLRQLSRAIKELLWGRYFPVLERWAERCMVGERDTASAAILQAHLAMLASTLPPSELDFRAVSTLLVAQVYLANFYAWDVDVDARRQAGRGRVAADDGLLVPQTEVLSLFQRQRGRLLPWLCTPLYPLVPPCTPRTTRPAARVARRTPAAGRRVHGGHRAGRLVHGPPPSRA